MEENIRILIFGSPCVGKTSVINLLTDENRATGNKLNGTTFQYCDIEHKVGTRNFIFTDTVGISEKNFYDFNTAKSLEKFLSKTNQNGYNLLIHVKKLGVIIDMDKENYDNVVKKIFQNKLNSIIVLTFGDDELSMDEWWLNNRILFQQKRMNYADGISVCSGRTNNPKFERIFKELREASKTKLWHLIEKNLMQPPVMPNAETSLFKKGLDLMGLNMQKRVPKNEKIDLIDEIEIELHELALMCKGSKNFIEDHEKMLKEKNLHRLRSSFDENINKSNGYLGTSYVKLINDSKNIKKLVIAHGGTNFDQMGNIIADLDIAQRKEPEIINDAIDFEHKVLNYVKASFSLEESFQIIHTGFSLGGFIASACVIKNNIYKCYGVTFDSPGQNYLVKNESVRNYKIVNLVTHPNLVNTCNKHVGKIYQIYEPTLDESFLNIKSSILKLIQEVKNTLRTHCLDDLIKLTKDKNKIKTYPVLEWSVANNKLDYKILNENIDILKASDVGLGDSMSQLLSQIEYNRSNKVVYNS